jgi:hypothetical protein
MNTINFERGAAGPENNPLGAEAVYVPKYSQDEISNTKPPN